MLIAMERERDRERETEREARRQRDESDFVELLNQNAKQYVGLRKSELWKKF